MNVVSDVRGDRRLAADPGHRLGAEPAVADSVVHDVVVLDDVRPVGGDHDVEFDVLGVIRRSRCSSLGARHRPRNSLEQIDERRARLGDTASGRVE